MEHSWTSTTYSVRKTAIGSGTAWRFAQTAIETLTSLQNAIRLTPNFWLLPCSSLPQGAGCQKRSPKDQSFPSRASNSADVSNTFPQGRHRSLNA